MVFNVTLSRTNSEVVTASFQTVDDTAFGGEDFIQTTGVLTFEPGETNQLIEVPVIPDHVYEPDETFYIQLSNLSNAWVTDKSHVYFFDDDQVHGLEIDLTTLSVTNLPDSPYHLKGKHFFPSFSGTKLSVSQDGQYVYSVSPESSFLNIFRRNIQNGMLELINGMPVSLGAGESASSLHFHPSGKFLYILMWKDILGFEIKDDDTLSKIPGLPRISNGWGHDATFDADGNFFYVLNTSAQRIEVYSCDPISGVLTHEYDHSILIDEYHVTDIATHPDGDFLFVINNRSNESTLHQFALDPLSGAVSDMDQFTTNAAAFYYEILFHPAGKYCYLTHEFNGILNGFSFNAQNGVMSPIVDPIGCSSCNSEALCFDPSGRFMYTFNHFGFGIYQTNPDTGTFILLASYPEFDPDEIDELHVAPHKNTFEGRIINDDVGISVQDGSLFEGNAGSTSTSVGVLLSLPSTNPVSVSYYTMGGSAVEGVDYATASGTLMFAPGETNKTIHLMAAGDLISEYNEDFSLLLTNAVNATLADGEGMVVIKDEDEFPNLTVNPIEVIEGNSSTKNFTVNATLSQPSEREISCLYVTHYESDHWMEDFKFKMGELVFPPGSTNQEITFSVFGDTVSEADEEILLRFCSPKNVSFPGVEYLFAHCTGNSNEWMEVRESKLDPETGTMTQNQIIAKNKFLPSFVESDPFGWILFTNENFFSGIIINEDSRDRYVKFSSTKNEDYPHSKSIVQHPSGRYAYGLQTISRNTNVLTEFQVNYDSISIIDSTNSPSVGGEVPYAGVVDPKGNFLYVANLYGNNISVHSINPIDGSLSELPESPLHVGFGPDSLAMDPQGRFLYVATSNALSTFAIDAGSGILTPVPKASLEPLEGPGAVVIEPRGNFLYLSTSEGIRIFERNSFTGVLKEINDSPVVSSERPYYLAIDGTGSVLLTNHQMERAIRSYLIDSVTGALTPSTDSPIPAGMSPYNLAISPPIMNSKITILNDDAPYVTITNPKHPRFEEEVWLVEGTNIWIEASRNNPSVPVDFVNFYVNNEFFASDNTEPYRVLWTNLQKSCSLRAVVTSSGSINSTSPVVDVGVNDLPKVSITAPANGSMFISPTDVHISANASNNLWSLIGVELLVDNGVSSAFIASDASSPYGYTWSGVAPGTYQLFARAIDDMPLTNSSARISIEIKTNQPPLVSITAPANGRSSIINKTHSIIANAIDPDGMIASVDFYSGSSPIGMDVASPYQITWLSSQTGTFLFRARATDNKGLMSTSSPVNVIVTLPKPGDFDLDGKADILWRNPATGDNLVWAVNGGQIQEVPLPKRSELKYTLVGANDFNGDDRMDLLWRNQTAGGLNEFWLLDGLELFQSVNLPGMSTNSWKVTATGDFNQDDHPDILWRNSRNGENMVWALNETSFLAEFQIQSWPNLKWKITVCADFNEDGSEDILWRNSETGACRVWYMQGTDFLSAHPFPSRPAAWNIFASADYNDDDHADIVWRNVSTGANQIWFMNNTNRVGTLSLPKLDSKWQMVGPR